MDIDAYFNRFPDGLERKIKWEIATGRRVLAELNHVGNGVYEIPLSAEQTRHVGWVTVDTGDYKERNNE